MEYECSNQNCESFDLTNHLLVHQSASPLIRFDQQFRVRSLTVEWRKERLGLGQNIWEFCNISSS
jgi:hypothetical protein